MHPTVVLLSVSVIALAMPSAIARRIRHQRIEPVHFARYPFASQDCGTIVGTLLKLFSFLRIGKHARQNFYGGQDRLRNDFENRRQFSLYCSHTIRLTMRMILKSQRRIGCRLFVLREKYTFRDTFRC